MNGTMTTQNALDEIITDYVREARFEYVGLWQIISRVRRDLRLLDRDENKKWL
jgi:hypothetical protein